MGRVVVSEFVSLDGVMEDPGGAEGFEHGGWAFKFDRGEAGDRFKHEELMAADAQLLGRVTYEGFAAAWPRMQGDQFGQRMNEMPKYVVSSTLERADWNNSHLLRGEPAEEVARLRERYERDILVAGSATLVHELTARGLVDEYRLMVFPILLGAGKRLFTGAGAPRSMQLIEAAQAGDCLTATFRPAGA
jgi:dihydrofolate reductase